MWSRRTFLTRAGLGGLAAAGLTTYSPRLQAEAAGEQSKLVVTWNSFDTMDLHVQQDVSAATFTLNIYDNLLRYQGNPPEIVPWLAEAYTVSDDGKTWTFHLRRGVHFDDGAEAVRFSFERLLTLGKAPAAIFTRMGLTPKKVRAIAPYTVKIQLARSFGPFRETLPIISIGQPCPHQGARTKRCLGGEMAGAECRRLWGVSARQGGPGNGFYHAMLPRAQIDALTRGVIQEELGRMWRLCSIPCLW